MPKIQNIVAKGTARGICTIYRSQITSIDDTPVLSPPSLCRMLFDNRFEPLGGPDLEEESEAFGEFEKYLPWWFD